ncbi:hybrid sensor histidine kinase/response regulator [Puteibacter caeruleilacunae]|nr:hybrid sensor histidine kinase/response regulator [Puteibacter caeruleilacunae]
MNRKIIVGNVKYLILGLLLLVGVITPYGSHALEKVDMNFIHLTVADGLSNNTVKCSYQDYLGKVWIGTEDGLNCYDGYENSTYYALANDSSSLISSKILVINEDVQNQLWIGTSGGLCRYERSQNSFKRYNELIGEEILGILKSSFNDLYVTTSTGIFIYNAEYDYFSRIEFVDQFLKKRRITSRMFDLGRGRYFLMVGIRPVIYTPEERSFNEIHVTAKIAANAENKTFMGCVKLAANHFLLSNIAQGLYQLKYDNGKWSLRQFFPKYFKHNGVRDLLKDQDGHIWIGSYRGLYVLRSDGSMEHVVPNNLNPHTISYQSITNLMQARDYSIWIGTYFGGINIYRKKNNQFQSFIPGMLFQELSHNSIRGLALDGEGNVWCGTQGSGIVIYNTKANKFRRFKKEELEQANIHDIIADKYGRIWIGTYLDGLYMFDPRTRKLVHLNNLWKNKKVDVSAMFIDEDDHLWIGSDNIGLKTLKLTKNTYAEVSLIENENLIGPYVKYLYHLKNGDVLISTTEGILKYASDSRLVNFVTLDEMEISKTSFINVIKEDSKGNVWYGSADRGLWIYYADGTMKKLDNESGLVNNAIYGLQEDQQGRMWISTNRGLNVVSKDLAEVRLFTSNDGLVSNQFSKNSSLLLNDGRLMFGSVRGISIVNTDIKDNEDIELVPVIMEVNTFNENILAERDLMSSNKNAYKEISLEAKQNSFSVKYNAFYFGGMDKLKYQYRLRGVNDQWRITNQRIAEFNNIDAGAYTFQVQVWNPDGKWSNIIDQQIHVLPVWYKSSWAYMLYILLLLGIGYAIYRFMHYRVLMMNKIKLSEMEVEKVEEVNQMKLQFFTNISHEFRTPLTLLSGPIENLLHKETNEENKVMLQIARRNSLRLLRLINNILDFRKAGQKGLLLNLKQYDFANFLREQCNIFDEPARKKGVELVVDIDKSVAEFVFDAEKIETVIYNLLSNALKFTPEGGTIKVKASQNEGQVYMVVADTGMGIPAEQLPHIFERFYQVDEQKNAHLKGSGIGLSLVKSIIDAHHGEISVDSTSGLGTTFHVFLPNPELDNSYESIQQWMPSITVSNTEEGGDVAEEIGNKKGITILIIDDNKDLLTFLSHSLAADYRIVVAENGEEGLKQVEKYNPAIIISDVMMPQMDGIEFSQRLKDNIDTSHIPLILLSAKSTMEERIEGISTGAEVYITKPFSIDYLKIQVKNLLALIETRHKGFTGGQQVKKKEMKLSKRDEKFLVSLNEMIEDKLDDTKLSIDEIAKTLLISSSTLYRKTLALTGKGINDYIRYKRLVKAAELLKQEEYSISQIAYMTGFNTPSYFTQCFKKEFNVLPKEYIERES